MGAKFRPDSSHTVSFRFSKAVHFDQKKERIPMRAEQVRPCLILSCVLLLGLIQAAAGKTLCVNPAGSGGCHKTIQSAVNAASANDVVNVAPGTYAEDVVIGKTLSLLG